MFITNILKGIQNKQAESIERYMYINLLADHLQSPFFQKRMDPPTEVQLNSFCYKQIN
jgi:hypothetical protein